MEKVEKFLNRHFDSNLRIVVSTSLPGSLEGAGFVMIAADIQYTPQSKRLFLQIVRFNVVIELLA